MAKIKFKISKPVFYIIIVIVTAIVVYASIGLNRVYEKYSWKKHTQEEAKAKLLGEVNRIQKMITSIEQIPQNLAYVLEFSRPKKEHMNILLKAVVANNDEIFGSCIAYEPYAFDKDSMGFAPYLYKKDGKIISVNASDSTYYYFSMDWYLIPRNLKKPVWIEPYFDEGPSGGNVVLSTYSVPFYTYDGVNEKFAGIVSVDISLEWLSKMVSSIKLAGESHCILLSENGTVLSAPNTKWPYNETIYSLAEENDQPLLAEVGRELQKGKSGFVNIGRFDGERNLWIYYMPIPANNWGVILVVPERKD
jgi:phosphoserine phosphatase RsbU/P